MNSYVELVRRRLEDRTANLLENLEELPEAQLRFTMRIFGDCVDDETAAKLFAGYSEHMAESELREFAKRFVPAYTGYAIAELEEKKRDGERFEPPFLTREEYQEMSVREKWPRIAERPGEVLPAQLRREIAKAAMLLRPYMLSDPGFNESVLEFSLYFDLLDRLRLQPEARLRETASEIARRDRAGRGGGGDGRGGAPAEGDPRDGGRRGRPDGGPGGAPGAADGEIPAAGAAGIPPPGAEERAGPDVPEGSAALRHGPYRPADLGGSRPDRRSRSWKSILPSSRCLRRGCGS